MGKLKISGEILISAILAMVGIVVIISSISYGVWKGIHPGKGFMPLLASVLLTGSSLVFLINAVRLSRAQKNARFSENKDLPNEDLENQDSISGESDSDEVNWPLIVPLICLITVFLMDYLGTHLAMALFLFGWMRFISKFNWVRSFLYTISISSISYGIFTKWLAVPFPTFSLF